MSDADAFYKPGYRPPVQVRKPGRVLWTLHKGARIMVCELHFRGESYGWEVQFLEKDELRFGRGAFVLRSMAEEWAAGERKAQEAEGWQPV